MSKDPRERIIEVLRTHPEGLTLQKLSELVKMSRLTTTKYVHELIGAGIVYQRKVGVAKLCYLKNRYIRVVNKKELLEIIKKKLMKKRK